MYQQQSPDNQVSPIDEPLPGSGTTPSHAQPSISYDHTGSLDYETRPDWNLDTPSKYDLNGPISTADRLGSMLDRSENQTRSDFQKAVDPRIRPEDFAQAISGWQPQQTPENIPNIAADPYLAGTYSHDFQSSAASPSAFNINAKIVGQQDIHEKDNIGTGGIGNEPLGSTYHVPAHTRARWELLKSLVKGRDGPHDQTAEEASTASAKNAGSGSRTRPNQFQGLPQTQSSSKSMRTLMLPQIVERRKSTEGLSSDPEAVHAMNTSQKPLMNPRQENTAVQQYSSNYPAPEQQAAVAHASPPTLAAQLPDHQTGVPSTDPSATLSNHPVSHSAVVSVPQQFSHKSAGDTALRSARLRPPTDTRSQPPTSPSLPSKAPLPPQGHSRPTPNLGSETAPNPPPKNLTAQETAQKQHIQSGPPYRPQQTASAMLSSGAATQFNTSSLKTPTTVRQPAHEIGAAMQSATRISKIHPGTPPHKADTFPKQGQQLSHHPQAQSRTFFSNMSPSSAPVKASAATGVGAPVLAPQPKNLSTAHSGPASSPSPAKRIPVTGSSAVVHPNSAETQQSSALQPGKKPPYLPTAVAAPQKQGHAPSIPTMGQALPSTRHPQKSLPSQVMQPSHTGAQNLVASQHKPETASIAQPQSKSPLVPHAPTPHAPAPHAPAPSAAAAAPTLASSKPPAKPPQIPPRSAQALGGNTHGTPSQVHPSQEPVTSHTTHSTSSQPYTKPSQAHSQGQHPAAPLSGTGRSSPVPLPKPPRACSEALVSPPKHPSQTVQSQHVPLILPTSTSVAPIAPANHPAPTNRPTPANHDTPLDHAASATQQHRVSPSLNAAASTSSALRVASTSNVPCRNLAVSHLSASKGATSGNPSSSNSTGSLSVTGDIVRRNTPISASAIAQNAVPGLHPSRSEPSRILHTNPPNIFSMGSEATASETQHAYEAEESEGGNIFELLVQLAGGREPDGELSLEQEADNMVQSKLSLPSPCILVLPHVILHCSMAELWLQCCYMVPLLSSSHILTR
jgi:hypothetical protein